MLHWCERVQAPLLTPRVPSKRKGLLGTPTVTRACDYSRDYKSRVRISNMAQLVAHACTSCGDIHLPADAPHYVLERLGIVPVYREDKIDGSDVASITYDEAVVLAERIDRIGVHAHAAASDGSLSYREAIVNILRELGVESWRR